MYKAKVIVARDIVPHPDPEVTRIQILRFGTENFVVGKDVQVGDTVILFPSDGQLSYNFCFHNNLHRNSSLNKDAKISGFFEDNRRVRVQPFRKIKSSGFVCKPESFYYLGYIEFRAGDEFDTLNGVEICKKYYTQKTLEAMKKNQGKKEKEITYALKEHVDTEKWAYSKPLSIQNSLVVITEKIHGTSARTGNVRVTRKTASPLKRLLNLLTFKKNEVTQYELVSGTRRTIVNNRQDITVIGQQDHYRWMWHQKIAPLLNEGESIYYEIVGWDSLGGTIMEKQDLKKIKDATKIASSWLNPMIYSYGLPIGENDVYVYRITQETVDGREIELSWFEVEKRSRELGLKTVPVLDIFTTDDIEALDKKVISHMTDGSSSLDERHMSEGICIRIESNEGFSIFKSKNFGFLFLEGVLKDASNYVDKEEAN